MSNPRLLLVDDEPNILKSLQRLFFEEDYEVFTGGSGEEGLKILREEEVDLIISDYRMPVLTGTGFFKQARQLQPDAVRIILSGYAEIPALTAAINEGNIYQFIFKPWNDEDLKNTIRLALQQRSLTFENRKLAEELKIKNQQLQEYSQQLEQIVDERTAELSQHYKVLQVSQAILEHLPVGVIGISEENIIVLMNELARQLFPLGLGEKTEDVFPGELQERCSNLESTQKEVDEMITMISDSGYQVILRQLSSSDIGKGIILILQEVSREESLVLESC